MYDLIIAGGMVADGSGSPVFRADVGITHGRISFIGPVGQARAKRVMDAAGHLVSPGFVDVHSHGDIALLRDPRHAPKVMQGVTTEIFSNCGIGYAPALGNSLPMLREQFGPTTGDFPDLPACSSVREYLGLYEGKTACNVAYLVSHGAIRASVLGLENRTAKPAELARMRRLVAEAMLDGAFGLSTGLFYVPMRYADLDELEALSREVAAAGGVLSTHVRNYYENLIESHEEVLGVARSTKVRLQLSHLVAPGKANWGKGKELVRLMQAARDEGLDVACDCYPYLAGSSSLAMFLPPEILAGGRTPALARLGEASLRPQIYAHLRRLPFEWADVRLCGVRSERNQRLVGRSLADVAGERKLAVPELICELLGEEQLEVSFLVHQCREDDLDEVVRHPAQMVGSDGLHTGASPHPRLFGAFPRFLRIYVRERKFFSWEQAIRKMTGIPAERFGLRNRGLIRLGMAADVVVLDPDRVADAATYEDPCRFPMGIPYVVCSGVLVKDGDQLTGELPGQVLRYRSPQRPT